MKITESLPVNGTPVATAALAARKSVIAEVTAGSVEVQASADGQFFCTVATLSKNTDHALLDVAATHMRVGSVTGNTVSVTVVAEQGRVRSGVVPVVDDDETGASLDVSAFGSAATIYVDKEPGGTIELQASADDGHFVTVAGPFPQSTCETVHLPGRFARAVAKNASASITVASEDPEIRALNSPTPTFVFRPGGTAGGNIYTDWTRLIEALSSTQGRRILEFDNSALTAGKACEIPAGRWPMHDVTWAGFGPRPSAGVFRTIVDILDGATFTGLRMIGGQITVQNQATSTPPIADFAPRSHVNIGLRDDSGTPELRNLGTQPMFDLGSSNVTFFIQNTLFGVNSTSPLITHSGGECTLVLLGLNQVGENVVFSSAGALVRFAAVSSAASIGRQQDTIVANGGLIAYEPTGRIQRRVLPLPSNPPLSASSVSTAIGVPNALVRCDGTGTIPFDLVLPSILETRLSSPTSLRIYTGGHEVVVAEVMGGANLRVLPSPDDTIDGSSKPVPIAPNGSRTFVSDGLSNWITISVVS